MKPTATDWPGACSHASLPDSLTVIVATRSFGIDTTLFDVGANLKQPVVEQATHGLMQARVDQFDSLGELVDDDPAAAWVPYNQGDDGTAAERL